ncbi:MAG: sulfite exporter TauE/SafE family protein [Promethearchaeota archaeon]
MDFLLTSGLIILGLAVGLIISIIGVSGSVFVIPILMLVYSTPIYAAIGTSLFIDMIGASVVALSFFRKKTVDLTASLLLIISALVGSQLGVLIAVNTSEASLSYSVCIIFISIGAIILLRGARKIKHKETIVESQRYNFKSEKQKKIIILLIGLFIGLMSGIFGAGGGMMIMFVLLILFQYPPHTAIGTATAIMAIIALSGVIGYSIQGYINLEYGIIVSLGAIVGGSFGSIFISHKLNENSLMIAMGLVFILVGIMTLILITIL